MKEHQTLLGPFLTRWWLLAVAEHGNEAYGSGRSGTALCSGAVIGGGPAFFFVVDGGMLSCLCSKGLVVYFAVVL